MLTCGDFYISISPWYANFVKLNDENLVSQVFTWKKTTENQCIFFRLSLTLAFYLLSAFSVCFLLLLLLQ